MTGTQIASLSLKLIGIFSIIQAIPILKSLSEFFVFKDSNFFTPENTPPSYNYLLIGILTSFLLLLILGACLIIFSERLAKKIIKENEDKKTLTDLSVKDIQAIAFSVIGVVMIVIAIPKLIQIGTNIQVLNQAGDEVPTRGISAGTWAYAIGLTVQSIIGLLLFFGARGLSSIWYFFQKIRPLKDIK